jgi:membrane protein
MDGIKRVVVALLAGLAVAVGLRRLTEPRRVPPARTTPAPPVPPPDATEADRGGGGPLEVVKGLRDRIKRDRVSLISGSLAYKSMLSLVPALVAAVSIYGLVLSPEDVEEQIDQLSAQLPAGATEIISGQLNDIVTSPGLGIGAVVGIVVALWSASSGAATLIQAINLAYETTDDRPFLRRRLLAVGFTVGFLAIGGLSIAAMAVLPILLRDAGFGGAAAVFLEYGRWPIVIVALLVGLALAYRFAPDRTGAHIEWMSWGALAATVGFLGVTAGFGYYATNFGRFNETYGTLGAVIVLLLWFYLSGFVILLGAELNAELEAAERGRLSVRDRQPAPG